MARDVYHGPEAPGNRSSVGCAVPHRVHASAFVRDAILEGVQARVLNLVSAGGSRAGSAGRPEGPIGATLFPRSSFTHLPASLLHSFLQT